MPTPPPIVYVVRHHSGYALYPFFEDIATMVSGGTGNLTPQAVIEATRHLSASLIMDAGGAVLWCEAGAVTLTDLESMPAYEQ